MRSLAALVLVAALAASSAVAACRDSAGNLLASKNCGFDEDVDGWTAAPGGSLTRDAVDDGVLEATGDSTGSLTIVGPCIPAQAAMGYRVGGRLRATAGTAYFCSINVFQYSDDHCTEGEEPLGSAARPPSATWTTVDGSATTSDVAGSLQLRPACSGEPGFVVQFDDFVISES